MNDPAKLTKLGESLIAKFNEFGDVRDLEESLLRFQQAVDLTPDDHSDKPGRLNNLGYSLETRFMIFGDVKDIDKAVLTNQQALDLIPDGHSNEPGRLSNLGGSLAVRFNRLGNMKDLHEAVLKLQQAVDLTSDDHSNKPIMLNNLGNSLEAQFNSSGDVKYLNDAVLRLKQAVNLTPDGDLNKPARLCNLGVSLKTRFDRLGDVKDLNEAVSKIQEAVNSTPDGHPDKPIWLCNLGPTLWARYNRLGDVKDLTESISTNQKAVDLIPDRHPDKSGMLSNLGNSLVVRFDKFGDVNDLNEGVSKKQQAVDLTPDAHPDKPGMLSNLGFSLVTRFKRLGDVKDLNEAASKKQQAVDLMPDGHPNKPRILMNLGDVFLNQYKCSQPNSDINKALDQFSAAAHSLVGDVSVKFEATSIWAQEAQNIGDSSTLDAYATGVSLIPELAWPGSLVEDRHFQIRKVHPFISDASIFAIQIAECVTAVEWLEQGCSIIWSQLLQLRSPFDNLKDKYPIQGLELEGLSSKLTVQSQSTATISEDHKLKPLQLVANDLHKTAEQRQSLINEIRKLPGFEQFLLPKQLPELSAAAIRGPIIILVANDKQADALVLVPGLNDDVLHVPLPNMHNDRLRSLYSRIKMLAEGFLHNRDVVDDHSHRLHIRHKEHQDPDVKEEEFRSILLKLWIEIVKPIVDGLALKLPVIPQTCHLTRIWWCSTGSFSFLPLHAVGDYSSDAPFGSKLTDYAISSYIPSVTALLQAQNSFPNELSKLKILVVAQPSAQGQIFLPGTEKEVKDIQQYARDSTSVKTLRGSDATIEKVTKEMKQHDWAHFACHGAQNIQEPLESALLLAGHSRLTINDIIAMQLPPKGLAFLSACQTATGDENLATEAVHLAAGMLSAGYRSVIGTMWSISDSYAPQVANDVYGFLLKDGKNDITCTAEALHYAVKNLQENHKVPFDKWVPFIHVGI
ncbi:hypothetical protein BT96DRAFT_821597 [Gymnopus androsaceus JB14]|uniref:CHAT domain-containing protein n=1 Tax=Gymnopus androsaceus JB14 TaxID=1447944 RepID=A0A6A4HL15_9AGAR|nr:hypothetical protein BT96DRAFT_821597 [Gymnopus androsaceus JB14]